MVMLALETSTPRGGVALARDGRLEFSESFTADRSHSSELFTVIERALAPGARPGQIVVGLGPGSYAGVRIAIASAIGLSVATRAELVGIPSIAALDEGEYLAVGDARRGAFSLARVRNGEIVDGPVLLAPGDVEARLAESTLPVFSSEKLGLPRVQLKFPDVERLVRLAMAGRGICARGILEPMYLREPWITKNSKFEIRNSNG